MMRLSLSALLLLLTLTPCFAAAKDLRATDSLGRTVVLSRPPKRIVSWAPNITEILFALGLGSRAVGVTSYCDFPAQAERLPKVGSITAPDVERTLALHPDIIIGSRLNPAALYRFLEDFGIRSFAVDAPETIEGVFAIIEAIGKITGSSDKAAALNRSMGSRLDRIRSLTKRLPASQRPSTLLIYQLDPLWTAGSDTFADEAIRIAGGTNAAADVRGYAKYSLETVLARAPQVILVTPMKASDAPAARRRVMSYAPFRKLPAVRQGRVYAVNPDWIDRAGPRLILGVEQIARLLHPEIFKRARAR
jgi:iron complex transport system substrate-binding protein